MVQQVARHRSLPARVLYGLLEDSTSPTLVARRCLWCLVVFGVLGCLTFASGVTVGGPSDAKNAALDSPDGLSLLQLRAERLVGAGALGGAFNTSVNSSVTFRAVSVGKVEASGEAAGTEAEGKRAKARGLEAQAKRLEDEAKRLWAEAEEDVGQAEEAYLAPSAEDKTSAQAEEDAGQAEKASLAPSVEEKTSEQAEEDVAQAKKPHQKFRPPPPLPQSSHMLPKPARKASPVHKEEPVQEHDAEEEEGQDADDDLDNMGVEDEVEDEHSDAPDSLREGAVVAYIQFGKAGSSSMRNILNHRALVRGWPVQRHQEAHCADVNCDSRICKAEGPYKDKDGIECSDEPDGAVITTTFPGYCEAVGSKRPCRYMTLLREPIDRTISAYNYWCRDCKDSHLFCKKGWSCPDMSIVEWARRHGNDYTRRFAVLPGHSTKVAHGFYADTGHSQKLTKQDFKTAVKFVKSAFVLTTDELGSLHEGQEEHRLVDFLNGDRSVLDSLPSARNTHQHGYEPTEAEMKELKKVLKYDIKLYEYATRHKR